MRLAITLLAALLTVASSAAAGVLDQQQTIHDGQWTSIGTQGYEGATFTAGTSGLLCRLDAYLSKQGDPGTITLEIHSASGGIPTALLGSLTYPSTVITTGGGSFDWYSFDLTSLAIAVTAGSQYAYAWRAQVNNNGPNYLMFALNGSNLYPGGTWVTQHPLANGGIPEAIPSHDAVFRTYVEAVTPARTTTWGRLKGLYR